MRHESILSSENVEKSNLDTVEHHQTDPRIDFNWNIYMYIWTSVARCSGLQDLLALSAQELDDGIMVHSEDFLQTIRKCLEICN